MRQIILLSILLTLLTSMQGQTEMKYPKTLWLPNDTFYVKFSNSPADLFPLAISENDTIDMGTDGATDLKATVYFGKDSLIFAYKNLPHWQVHYIPMQSPKGKTIYRLHFNSVYSAFTPQYIEKNNGTFQVEIPIVYELANIIWILSPCGQRANNLYKEGNYYKKVAKYFKPFLNHPLFSKLDFPDSLYFQKYYDFRENSLCFNLKNNKIVYDGPYYYVMGNDENYNNLFRDMLPLIQNFADKSKYLSFYNANRDFYSAQINLERELMPVKTMWEWLESQFPGIKYNSYKVVFSPLIKASHSTQNFATFQKKWFSETVMFVCGPDIYDNEKNLTEKQKEGLLSGIVFTEIDHNYVNPISSKYQKLIDSIFSKREVWVSSGGDTNSYQTPESVFNEYMTHSVFCLYILDNYNRELSDFIIQKRESLMVDTRHYIKFKEFNRALMELYKQNKDQNVVSLFPRILEWCKSNLR